MSSKIAKTPLHSAAWRISLWATLAFACGTLIAMVFLHRFVANDIHRRSDAWITGELGVLADVAERTPNDRLYGRVVGEVAELASREVPDKQHSTDAENDSVFFLQSGKDASLKLWVGSGDGVPFLNAIHRTAMDASLPSDLHVEGFPIPFRVASVSMTDGSHIYLGLSERDELRVLRNLRLRFLLFGLTIVLFGFAIVFFVTRRMLGHVRRITEAASGIGQSDLATRVPVSPRRDEIGQLSRTLNHMLDRVETTVHQLHTMTDALAHDLRSPLTAIRGKLEMVLSTGLRPEQGEPIVSVIEELDRLTNFLNTSLDVAEGRVDALRINRYSLDLDGLLRTMIDLYDPSMADRGLRVQLHSHGAAMISADEGLLHRAIANLLENELKHLPPASSINIFLDSGRDETVLIVEDDGPGFDPEVAAHLFDRRVKGRHSTGYGLGLAFIHAVVRAHGGAIDACNRPEGGARLTLHFQTVPQGTPVPPFESRDAELLAATVPLSSL